ncbi:Arsenite efflux pump ArsB, ACR3 family [Bartonella choladocola]|uniref:Arsenite efflux pump ArsB, ACR3 family n=2 Tax=Bartonella choladocola TaxID=2750995 RepID=A0A1U9MH68_9HYPH|nr:Arsenite efflux pump ArsB, ACR3 family [Bartonella choladocola]
MVCNHRNWPAFFEHYQIWFYCVAIVIGLVTGCFSPISGFANRALQVMLPLLLLVTFLQVPCAAIVNSFSDKRFIAGLIVGNFLFIPALVFLLLWSGLSWLDFPDKQLSFSTLTSGNNPYLYFSLFGAILLCAPCVDYVVSFCRMAKGDATALTAMLPVLLIVQLCFLFLWGVMGFGNTTTLADERQKIGEFLFSVVSVLVLPLCIAWLLQGISRHNKFISTSTSVMEKSVVPVTALTLMVIATYASSEIFSTFKNCCSAAENTSLFGLNNRLSGENLPMLDNAEPVSCCDKKQLSGAFLYGVLFYALYAFLAPFIGFLTAKLTRLGRKKAIALSFSVSTRNSLVLLPLLLSIAPSGGRALITGVVLTQTCVELVAEIIYLRLIPRYAQKHFRCQETECEQRL